MSGLGCETQSNVVKTCNRKRCYKRMNTSSGTERERATNPQNYCRPCTNQVVLNRFRFTVTRQVNECNFVGFIFFICWPFKKWIQPPWNQFKSLYYWDVNIMMLSVDVMAAEFVIHINSAVILMYWFAWSAHLNVCITMRSSILPAVALCVFCWCRWKCGSVCVSDWMSIF